MRARAWRGGNMRTVFESRGWVWTQRRLLVQRADGVCVMSGVVRSVSSRRH